MAVDINIKGDGLTYEASTSILKASQIIAFLNAGTEISASQQQLSSSSQNPQLTQLKYNNKTPIDALSESGAKTNMQKILVFARYHLEKAGGLTFDPQNIRIYFKKAGIGEPSNYNRDIRDAIALNYIYEEDKGEYVITDYGNKLLESGFDGEAKYKQGKKKQLSVKHSSKKNSILRASDSVSALEIVPKLEGIIPYHDIGKKGDRILWILYFAFQNSISELAPSDIEYMATKLLDRIPTTSLAALTEKSRKDVYLTKTNDGKFKLLHDGIEYLKNIANISDSGGHIQEADGK